MAESTRCYILETPREIRNKIYENITTTCAISLNATRPTVGDTFSKPLVFLRRTIVFDVLLINSQISDEYRDHCLPQSELNVVMTQGPSLSEGLGLVTTFPVQVLKRVRKYTLTLCWTQVHEVGNVSDMAQWCSSHTVDQLRGQECMSWTPSKGK